MAHPHENVGAHAGSPKKWFAKGKYKNHEAKRPQSEKLVVIAVSSEQMILDQLKLKQNLVVVSRGKDYPGLMTDLHREVSQDFKKICMITTGKSCAALIQDLKSDKINTLNYAFIDCISGKDQTVKHAQCRYVSSPSALTELKIAISEVVREKNSDLVIMENVSSLLAYNDPITVIQFLHKVMTSVRESGAKAIYTILEKDMTGLMEDLNLFSDVVIQPYVKEVPGVNVTS